MFNRRILFAAATMASLAFFAGSRANADDTECYTLASLQGSYGVVATYGANVALALAIRNFDGRGNLTGTFTLNAPDLASTTGARKITTGTQVGTYTVNCDGTGVFTRVLKTNGITATQQDDFVITASTVKDGQLIATEIEDATRVPSALVPGGLFVFRHFTRRSGKIQDAP